MSSTKLTALHRAGVDVVRDELHDVLTAVSAGSQTGPAVPWLPSTGELAGAISEIKKVIDAAFVDRSRRMGGEGERDYSPNFFPA